MDLWKLVAIVVLLLIAVIVFGGVLAGLDSGSTLGKESAAGLKAKYRDDYAGSGVEATASVWTIATETIPDSLFGAEPGAFKGALAGVFLSVAGIVAGIGLFKLGRSILGA